MGKPHPKGSKGEDIAARYLEGKQYEIVARNAHFRGGELDIVARDLALNELVFVEVKTRSTRTFGWPEEGVSGRKKDRLRRAASLFLSTHPERQGTPYRFDIIAIELSDGKVHVTHYKNVEMGA